MGRHTCGCPPILINKLPTRPRRLDLIRRQPPNSRVRKYFLDKNNDKRRWLVVIDEAHSACATNHRFRKEFQEIGKFVQQIPNNPRVLALSATVLPDMKEQVGEKSRSITNDMGVFSWRIADVGEKNSFRRKTFQFHIQHTEEKFS